MRVGIESLTRELISQHDWIFPVVNGERIGREIDMASVYSLHGIIFSNHSKAWCFCLKLLMLCKGKPAGSAFFREFSQAVNVLGRRRP